MMSFVHNFCIHNNIKYYLTGGTLLGAIRHKGFIPWDDDIDITMPREDYHRFLSLFKNGKSPDGRYAILNIDTNDNVVYTFSKIIDTRTIVKEKDANNVQSGVWIDIFPMDKMSDSLEDAKKLFNKVLFYRKVLACKITGVNYSSPALIILKQMMLKMIYAFRSRKWLINRINQLAMSYSMLPNSKYICMVVMGTYGIKEILESRFYHDAILVPFENYHFYAPSNYHEVLEHFYNDYMKLPPIEKRVSNHRIVAYWK